MGKAPNRIRLTKREDGYQSHKKIYELGDMKWVDILK